MKLNLKPHTHPGFRFYDREERFSQAPTFYGRRTASIRTGLGSRTDAKLVGSARCRATGEAGATGAAESWWMAGKSGRKICTANFFGTCSGSFARTLRSQCAGFEFVCGDESEISCCVRCRSSGFRMSTRGRARISQKVDVISTYPLDSVIRLTR